MDGEGGKLGEERGQEKADQVWEVGEFDCSGCQILSPLPDLMLRGKCMLTSASYFSSIGLCWFPRTMEAYLRLRECQPRGDLCNCFPS